VAPYDSLLDGSVDVLWGAVVPAPPSVDVTPLLEVEWVGVVPADHDLAEAGQVCADALAEETLLCIRNAPAGLTLPFVLGDVRPLRHAHLIKVDAGDSRSVISLLQPRQAAVVATGSWAASAPRPGFRELRLTDLHPLCVYAAHRHTDRRGPVRSLVELLAEVAAEGGQERPIATVSSGSAPLPRPSRST
jgi:DNA-binding transcriptional LysR family regulator